MNLVYGPARHEYFGVAQWLEHPGGVQKVIGSISVWDSDVFSLSRAHDIKAVNSVISSCKLFQKFKKVIPDTLEFLQASKAKALPTFIYGNQPF